MPTQEEINSILMQPLDGAIEAPQAPQIQEVQEVQEVPKQTVEPQIKKEKSLDELDEEEIQRRAEEAGWRADYAGRNQKTAREFLEVGEKAAPLILKDKKRLEAENEILRKSHERMMQTSADTVKTLKEDYERRIQELETVKNTAKENFDMDGFEKAIDSQDKIKQAAAKLEQSIPPIDPTVQLWAQDNADFIQKVEGDKVLSKYAEAVALEMRSELLQLAPAQRFDKIKERVMQELPERFSNPNQQQAPKTLTMPRTQTPQKSNDGRLTVSSLPSDEKAAYDLIVKAQHFKSPEQRKAFDDRYLENYKIMRNQK